MTIDLVHILMSLDNRFSTDIEDNKFSTVIDDNRVMLSNNNRFSRY